MKKTFRKTELTSVNYPGMFDFIKGWAMIQIVIGHIENLFTGGILYVTGFPGASVVNAIISFVTLDNVTIVLFMLISGYGFRPAPLKSTLHKQAKQLLKPYVIVAGSTIGLHLIAHYAAFHYLKGAIKQTLLVAAGYFLGASLTFTYKDNLICSIGAVWYLLTLFLSWILLDFIMIRLPEKMHAPAVVICTAAGWSLTLIVGLPYCIEQALIGVGYIYLGYYAKKKNWFSGKKPVYVWILLAAAWLISVPGYAFDIASNQYELGFLSILLTGAAALLVMMLFLKLNAWEYPLRSQICTIGRYSLWIMCLSTVCSQALPWYLISQKTVDHKYLGFLLIFMMQSLLLWIGYRIIKMLSDRKARRLREEKKRKRAEKRLQV